jgi:hypothetical protein
VQDRGADHDEQRAHDERADDAVGEQLVPFGHRYAERGEHEQEHEDVVERQALLDEVAGQERARVLAAPERQQHAEERQRDPDPHDALYRGRAQGHLASADDEQVDRQQDGDGGDQGDPGRRHGHELLRGWVGNARRFLRL